MAIAMNSQIGVSTKKRYSTKKLARVRPQKFTLREQKQSPKQISDLEWQIKFTKMKLGLWRDLENDKWTRLEAMHKEAKSNLKEQKRLYYG